MGKSDNYSLQFDDDIQETDEWKYEDDWAEDSIHARKDHQSHRGRGKGQITRRDIEDFKEQQQLKALIGDDFDD